MSKSIHLPGLNGLRALAALSVLWGHTFQGIFGDWQLNGGGWNLPVVYDGVTLFFVISGFLITYLLLNEQERSRKISVGKFYMRRILRIWPIYFLYLVLALTITNSWQEEGLWYYLVFVANIPFIMSVGILPIAHYWSISVEEQYYLFWPWLVKLTKGNWRRLMYITLGVCGLWLICKYGLYLTQGTTLVYRFFAATRFDCMMLGAVGAILFHRRQPLFMKVLGNRWVGLLCLLTVGVSVLWAEFVPAPLRPQVIAVLSLGAIMGQVAGNPVINLENRVMDSIGKVSYGIYVIHPLMIGLLSIVWQKWNPALSADWSTVLIYIGVTMAVYAVAWISYNDFERPFLKLKNTFAVVQSSSSMKE